MILVDLTDSDDADIVEELLYQICIDVNPALESHQVNLPSASPSCDSMQQASSRNSVKPKKPAASNFGSRWWSIRMATS